MAAKKQEEAIVSRRTGNSMKETVRRTITVTPPLNDITADQLGKILLHLPTAGF
jgi:hypothetical protein